MPASTPKRAEEDPALPPGVNSVEVTAMQVTAGSSPIDYDTLIKDDRVHGRLYYDVAIFEEELEKIWYREWIFIGHESEIPHPGDYVVRRIARQPIVVTRADDGQIHVLLNRCPHRGNAVCQTERGNTRVFRCAYHGWTFNNRGDLLGVSFQSGYDEDFRKDEMGMTRAPRLASYRGLLFASLSPDGISLDEHLGQARKYIDQFVDLSPTGEIEVQAGIHKMRVQSNWKMYIENGVDNYHANFVHRSAVAAQSKELLAKLRATSGDASLAVTRDLGGGHTMLDFFPQNRVAGLVPTATAGAVSREAEAAYVEALRTFHGPARADALLAEGPPHVMIFPNLFITNFGIDMRTIHPLAPDLFYNYHLPALLKGAPSELNTYRIRRYEGAYGPAGFFLADDMEMWERNYRGTEARVNEWVTLRRGVHRERLDADGFRIAHITDELPQRTIWRHYKMLMTRP
jgi:phenylpropionate dioxygenase-like ring-hydroxylating dioxygenase large terminal subunit